jgi:hypothetical protein
MTEEERKLQFEQEIQRMAVAGYYAYVDKHKRVRKEKDARMFYDAMRLGIRRGMNFMAHQYELQKQQEKQDGKD